MNRENQVRQSLQAIEQAMQDLALWQAAPPEPEAFSSTEPFCVDSMRAEEWLQWVLLPRMMALLDAGAALPTRFMIAPYFEEALKDKQPNCMPLLALLQHLDSLLNNPPG
ncbi:MULTISPECIES: YqcC family protein [unclassified Serratia (in: enterobacteria)]|uniref:YqcC family protein n=1 Tax=unclassified Serratia (in: enterobacteria) TaxID=2647522 RepID=UPI003076455A